MPWGDTALITESVKRKEKVVKQSKTITEELSFATDPKDILAKKPEQKLNWAAKAIELGFKRKVSVNLVFDIFSNPRFILAFGQGRGAKFRALVNKNLELFSSKQQTFLQSENCKLATFEGGADSDSGDEKDPKAMLGGRTVEVLEPFEVYNQGEDKTMLKQGGYGVVSRIDKDGDALIDFFAQGQTGGSFAMWVFKKDHHKLTVKEKIVGSGELKLTFKNVTPSVRPAFKSTEVKSRKAPVEPVEEEDDPPPPPVPDDFETEGMDDSGDPSNPVAVPSQVKRKDKLSGLFQPDEKLKALLEMGKQSVSQAKADIKIAMTQEAPAAPISFSFANKNARAVGAAFAATAAGNVRTQASNDELSAPPTRAIRAVDTAATVVDAGATRMIIDADPAPAPRSPREQYQPRRSGRGRDDRDRGRSHSGRALLRRIRRRDERSRSASGSRSRSRGRNKNVHYVWKQAGLDYIKDRGRSEKHGQPEVGSRLRTTPPADLLDWMLDEGHCREEDQRDSTVLS